MPDDINAMRAKLARATQAMSSVSKTKTANVGTYTYTYATLTDVLTTVKNALTEQGLVLMQPIEIRDGFQVVSTLITDITTGEYLMFPGPGVPVKGDPQAAGSALTYNRRYALTSLFGLEVDDDDGATAHRAETKPQSRTEAEVETRKIIAALSADDQSAFQADFREEFHSTLTGLPESRHGEALKFAKFWTATDDAAKREADVSEAHS
jgi:hypothetical protein